MIDDEQRARLSTLALQALDDIDELYGDEAELVDAVLVYEVRLPGDDPDSDDEDDTVRTELNHRSTNFRSTVTSGMLRIASENVAGGWTRADDDEDDEL